MLDELQPSFGNELVRLAVASDLAEQERSSRFARLSNEAFAEQHLELSRLDPNSFAARVGLGELFELLGRRNDAMTLLGSPRDQVLSARSGGQVLPWDQPGEMVSGGVHIFLRGGCRPRRALVGVRVRVDGQWFRITSYRRYERLDVNRALDASGFHDFGFEAVAILEVGRTNPLRSLKTFLWSRRVGVGTSSGVVLSVCPNLDGSSVATLIPFSEFSVLDALYVRVRILASSFPSRDGLCCCLRPRCCAAGEVAVVTGS